MFLFLKPRSERSSIDKVILRLQKSIASIPGITAVLTPTPVLQISVGATSQAQGQYAYTISGIVPQDVYAMADELMKKLQQFKGFASVRSDYYHNTPNLKIDINRDRAATYGVSTSAIQSLMRNAYSQNYIYHDKPGSAACCNINKGSHRSASGESFESVHQRYLQLQSVTRRRDRRCYQSHRGRIRANTS
jgi:multidrug efflux pump subunit AcrB